MNRSLLVIYAMFLCAGLPSLGHAQEATRPTPIPLWHDGAPGAKGQDPEDIPTISLYQPVARLSTGAAIVICPGGAYQNLADHEGHSIAVWLNGLGITAVVLKYRLAPRYHHPAPLQDVTRAMRTVRARAREWGVDPDRIGVMGFSAGGHLAATIATHFDAGDPSATDPIERVSSRPTIAVLAYPVISMADGITHAGSRSNLLGPDPSPALIAELSNDQHVTLKTPPTFLFHTADDPVVPVENSFLFAAALRSAKVPYELHVFEHGAHGVGLAQDGSELSIWPTLLQHWLTMHGFAK